MSRFCLSMQRFLLSAWVGAAVLFVITSVAEQQFDGFDAAMKNRLALIRFPKYYAMGFAVLLASLGGSLVRFAKGNRGKADMVVLAAVGAALLLMLGDFASVYRPLHEIMIDFERARDAEFTRYHQLSKYINATGILLSLVAATAACCSIHKERGSDGK